MTIRELLDIAIQHEVGSQELYRHLKGIVTDASTITLLDDLIREEEAHEAILRGIIDAKLYSLAKAVENPDIIEEIRSSHSVYVTIDANSTIEDIVLLALKRELRARSLFERLAENSHDEEQRQLFTKLAAEEASHQVMIEKRYSSRVVRASSEM
jgi:rubrerythrin